MKNIDFLPKEYREQTTAHQTKLWSLLVIVLFGSAISLAAVLQYGVRHSVRCQRTAVESQYTAAKARTQKLDKLQRQLDDACQRAKLYTYLKYPWPRTQIVASLVEHLPESITLRELQIVDEQPTTSKKSQYVEERSRRSSKKKDKEPKLPPVERDLENLRKLADGHQTVVYITGITNDAVALHEYLAALNMASLFTKAELRDIEDTKQGEPGQSSRFRARMIVRPGFGQKDGPTEPLSSLSSTCPHSNARSTR